MFLCMIHFTIRLLYWCASEICGKLVQNPSHVDIIYYKYLTLDILTFYKRVPVVSFQLNACCQNVTGGSIARRRTRSQQS